MRGVRRLPPGSRLPRECPRTPGAHLNVFSNVTSPHKSTGVLGRGTEEMKTTDVTGRLRAHRVNVSMKLGRPGISASFANVEVLSRAISPERLPLPACIFRKKTPSPT